MHAVAKMVTYDGVWRHTGLTRGF